MHVSNSNNSIPCAGMWCGGAGHACSCRTDLQGDGSQGWAAPGRLAGQPGQPSRQHLPGTPTPGSTFHRMPSHHLMRIQLPWQACDPGAPGMRRWAHGMPGRRGGSGIGHRAPAHWSRNDLGSKERSRSILFHHASNVCYVLSAVSIEKVVRRPVVCVHRQI